MRFLSLSSYCLLLSLFLQSNLIAKEWRGVVPLHSTRSDVEKVFSVKSSNSTYDAFDLSTETVIVFYAKHPCENDYDKWKVPIGTVLEIVVSPKVPQPLSSLDIDLRVFKRSLSRFTDTSVIMDRYENEDVGLAIEVVGEKVVSLYYRPSAKDRELLCSSKTPK